MNRQTLAGLIAGLLFGAGLGLAGMTDPAVVIGFLDLAGAWNPALAFVMAGAVVVTFIGYRLVLQRGQPVFAPRFQLPGPGVVDLPLAAVASVLDAAVRGFDIVIVDAPRCAADTVREALRRATATFLVVPCEFRAVAAAQRVLLSIGPSGAPVRLVTRGPSPSGLDPHWVATSLGLELVADLRHDGRVAAAVERGESLPERGSLTKVADAVLDTAVTGYGAP